MLSWLLARLRPEASSTSYGEAPLVDFSNIDSWDPLAREFEKLELEAARKARERQSARASLSARVSNTIENRKAASTADGSIRSQTEGPTSPSRPKLPFRVAAEGPQNGMAYLDERFNAIPEDLRRRALVWMLKSEMVRLYDCGQLEDKINRLERVNGITATSFGCDQLPRFEGQANDGGGDATLGYFDAYREGGRFGSHPSHDDYGDESHA